MKTRLPKVLIVFSKRHSDTNTAFGGFVTRLKKRGDLDAVDISFVALEDLLFEIINGDAAVTDLRTGEPIEDFDWVYFKSWEGMPDEAAALAEFLLARGIPFADHAVILKGNGNKLVSHLKFWANILPIANTVYCASHHLQKILPSINLNYPLVIKAVNGQKGRLNYLANNYDEAKNIITNNTDIDFLIQELIPNTHDLRIQVYGGKVALIIKRMAQKGSHLNNTSAGGGAQLIDINQADSKMVRLAEKAAEVVDLQVSGVDIMPNSKTGKYYILEANQGSQIVTGKFTYENMGAFNKYLATQAKVRLTRKNPKKTKLAIIGRHELVDIPDLDITYTYAKVDTGAYRSSIHVEDIELINKNKKPVLKFVVPAILTSTNKAKLVETEEFDTVPVKKSSSYTEQRYIIKSRLRLGGRNFVTSFTLTNRGSMRYPILIGRRVLRGRFLVNPELSQQIKKVEKVKL